MSYTYTSHSDMAGDHFIFSDYWKLRYTDSNSAIMFGKAPVLTCKVDKYKGVDCRNHDTNAFCQALRALIQNRFVQTESFDISHDALSLLSS